MPRLPHPAMKKPALFFVFLILICSPGLQAQHQGLTFSFSALHTCRHAPPDSILIENLDQEGSIMLHHPDTSVTFVYTSVPGVDLPSGQMELFQNYPNPFSGTTHIDVYLPRGEELTIRVYNLTGQITGEYSAILEPGTHQFTFRAGNQQTYLLTASAASATRQQVMLHLGRGSHEQTGISYNGMTASTRANKASPDFHYNLGDELRFTGYVTDYNAEVDSMVITDTPEEDTAYVFDIANQVPEKPAGIKGETWAQGNTSGIYYEVEPMHGVTYVWDIPESWELEEGQGGHKLSVKTGDQSGQVSVYAENACGRGEETVLDVEVFFTLTVAADPPEGGTVSPTYAEVEAGGTVTVTATPNDEWFFSKWEDETGETTNPQVITMNESETITAHFSKTHITIHKIDLNHLSSVRSERIKWLESAFHSTMYYRFQGDEYMLATGGSDWESEDWQAATILLKKKNNTWEFIKDYSDLEITSEFRNSEFFPNELGLIGCDHGAEPSFTDWPYGHIFYGEFIPDGIKWTQVSDVKSFYHGCAVGDITNNGLYDVLGANLGSHREDSYTDPHVYYQTEDGFEFQPNILPDHHASGFFTQIGQLHGDERNEIVRWGFIGDPDGPYLNVEILTQNDDNEYVLWEHYMDDRYEGSKAGKTPPADTENRHRQNTPGNWISDFNNNGLNDIAVENDIFDLNVLLNNGNGSFTREFVTTKESELQDWGGARFMGFELIDLFNNLLPDISTRAFYHFPDDEGYVDLGDNVWINEGGTFERMSELFDGYMIRLTEHTPFEHSCDNYEDQFGFLRGFVDSSGKFGWYGFLRTNSHCHADYDPKTLYLIEIRTQIDASYIN